MKKQNEITPYLVQRCRIRYVAKELNRIGIDNILEFEYMGSAEFEWGALPKSLDEIRSRINNYVYFDVTIKEKEITVFCLSEHKEQMENILINLSDKKYYLKEWSNFDRYCNNEKTFSTACWWDIKNHYLFWIKDSKFEMRFKKLIGGNKND